MYLSNQLFVYNLTQVFEEIDAPKPMELGGKNENASSAFDAMVGTVYVWSKKHAQIFGTIIISIEIHIFIFCYIIKIVHN